MVLQGGRSKSRQTLETRTRTGHLSSLYSSKFRSPIRTDNGAATAVAAQSSEPASTKWHPAERNRGNRSGGGGGKVGRRVQRLVLVLAVALAWGPSSLLAQECEDGILADNGTTCCLAACGVCGGEGCSDIEGTEETDCCVGDIQASGQTCGVDGVVAPCEIDPTLNTPAPSPAPVSPTTAPVSPTPVPVEATEPPAPTVAPVTEAPVEPESYCENGYPGWQSGEACCSESCGQCGGSGCGALGSADCCVDNIVAAGLVCGVNAFEAPCIIEVTTPAPLAEGETAAPAPDPTAAPVPDPTAAPVPATAPTRAPAPPTAATLSPVATSPSTSPELASTAPPMLAGEAAATPAPTLSECTEGIEGIQHGVACCPLACGQCGGAGCELIEGTGGASDCCSDTILRQGQDCSDAGNAPCILDSVDEVTDATPAEDTSSALSRRMGQGAGGEEPRRGAWAVVVIAGLATAGFALYN